MAEYWKSTPRYWCKYCSTYVRDTKLERQNHDATGKHQGAVKRSLKDLHRGKEREEREKDRAKREIDRLNGVVSGSGPTASSSFSSAAATRDARSRFGGTGGGPLSEGERQRQAEQLASLGVSIPQQFRGELAMAGEWTVTSTTVVEEKPATDNPDAMAKGVYKRERTEEEVEREEALRGLFKKPKRWGRDPKTAIGEGNEDLDALLGGGLVVKRKEEEEEEEEEAQEAKEEEQVKEEGPEEIVKTEPEAVDVKQEEDALPPIKEEPSNGDAPIPADIPTVPDENPDVPSIKPEDGDGAPAEAEAPAVVFKKRKPKNIRQK